MPSHVWLLCVLVGETLREKDAILKFLLLLSGGVAEQPAPLTQVTTWVAMAMLYVAANKCPH